MPSMPSGSSSCSSHDGLVGLAGDRLDEHAERACSPCWRSCTSPAAPHGAGEPDAQRVGVRGRAVAENDALMVGEAGGVAEQFAHGDVGHVGVGSRQVEVVDEDLTDGFVEREVAVLDELQRHDRRGQHLRHAADAEPVGRLDRLAGAPRSARRTRPRARPAVDHHRDRGAHVAGHQTPLDRRRRTSPTRRRSAWRPRRRRPAASDRHRPGAAIGFDSPTGRAPRRVTGGAVDRHDRRPRRAVAAGELRIGWRGEAGLAARRSGTRHAATTASVTTRRRVPTLHVPTSRLHPPIMTQSRRNCTLGGTKTTLVAPVSAMSHDGAGRHRSQSAVSAAP